MFGVADGERVTIIQLHRDDDGEIAAVFVYFPKVKGGFATVTLSGLLSEFIIATAQADEPGEDAAVKAVIGAIGEVALTDACKAAIEAAESAYAALTDEQKALVGNYATLADARAAYDKLAADAGTGSGSGSDASGDSGSTDSPASDSTGGSGTADDAAALTGAGLEATAGSGAGASALVVTVASDGSATVTSFKKSASSIVIDTVTTADGITHPVTAIAAKAFKGTAAKTVTIGDNVKTVGASAFANAKSLTAVTVGKNVTSIGKNAFKGCPRLKTVKLGASVKKVGASAFSGDKKLKRLTVSSANLTKASCKKMLKGSSVKTVKLTGMTKAAKAKALKKYKKWFPNKVNGKKLVIK